MPSSDADVGALRRLLHEQRGQVLPLTALMMVVLVGFAGMVVDVGRAYIAQRQLQNAVDSTALAIAQNMPNDYAGWCQSAGASYSTTCASLTPAPPNLGFSGITGARNALFGYGVTANPPTVTFACSPNAPQYDPTTKTCPSDASAQDAGTPCRPGGSLPPAQAGVGCNAVTVTESAKVKTTLAGVFGFANFNLNATATASAPQAGQTQTPLNVEVILDTTTSMQDKCSSPVTGIPNGQAEKIDCAKAGVQALLSGLSPCIGTAACGPTTNNPSPELGANLTNAANILDEVGLMAFPALTNISSRPNEIDCTAQSFGVQYPTPYPPPGAQPGYDIVGLSSDYRVSDTATTLNTSSALAKAVFWSQCPNGKYPNGDFYGLQDIGGQRTYLAGAIAEAQTLLTQASVKRPSAQNVIIVLSDGELNQVNFSNGGSDTTPCKSANTAATAAKTAKTLIYSIAYNSAGNCTDSSGTFNNVAGATLMRDIASGSGTFYNQPAAGDLTAIFTQIGQSLAQINSRLIPSP
jgi:Flp pilus assembly protein TadG